jgi:hypothetical protein
VAQVLALAQSYTAASAVTGTSAATPAVDDSAGAVASTQLAIFCAWRRS